MHEPESNGVTILTTRYIENTRTFMSNRSSASLLRTQQDASASLRASAQPSQREYNSRDIMNCPLHCILAALTPHRIGGLGMQNDRADRARSRRATHRLAHWPACRCAATAVAHGRRRPLVYCWLPTWWRRSATSSVSPANHAVETTTVRQKTTAVSCTLLTRHCYSGAAGTTSAAAS